LSLLSLSSVLFRRPCSCCAVLASLAVLALLSLKSCHAKI
jgi:hypothetical protein